MVYAALLLVAVCVVVVTVLGAMLVWERWMDSRLSNRLLRVQTAVAMVATGVALLAWAFAVLYMTPSGRITRQCRPNLVLVILVRGYTATAMLGGYGLWRQRTDSPTVSSS